MRITMMIIYKRTHIYITLQAFIRGGDHPVLCRWWAHQNCDKKTNRHPGKRANKKLNKATDSRSANERHRGKLTLWLTGGLEGGEEG